MCKFCEKIRNDDENALEILTDELCRNGVSVGKYNIVGRGSREPKKVLKTLFELDFTEHDKVFEDKIADLEQRIRELIKEKDEYKRKYNDFGFENQELKQRIAELESENKQLKHDIDKMAESKSEWIDRAVEWQQKCEKLESKETETCEEKTVLDDCRPSMEWYENRHQSDCIEINRLNTTIDVLIHKVEYLRQFAGME